MIAWLAFLLGTGAGAFLLLCAATVYAHLEADEFTRGDPRKQPRR